MMNEYGLWVNLPCIRKFLPMPPKRTNIKKNKHIDKIRFLLYNDYAKPIEYCKVGIIFFLGEVYSFCRTKV